MVTTSADAAQPQAGQPAPGAVARRFSRIAERFKVKFHITNVTGILPGESYEAFTRDFSAGGMFIELEELHFTKSGTTAQDNFVLFKGTMELEFSLPGADITFTPKGKVVWIEKKKEGRPFKHGVALSFIDLPPEQTEIINDYVVARLPKDDQPLPQVGEGER